MLQNRLHRRYVVTHPQYGVYLGCFADDPYWSKVESLGNFHCVAFTSPHVAVANILRFLGDALSASELKIEVVNTFLEDRANVVELENAGLTDLVGQLRENQNFMLYMAPVAGHA